MSNKGLLVVLSGPSGSEKIQFLNGLLILTKTLLSQYPLQLDLAELAKLMEKITFLFLNRIFVTLYLMKNCLNIPTTVEIIMEP